MPVVMGALKASGIEIAKRVFTDKCLLETPVPLSKEKQFLEHIEKIGIFKDKNILMP